MKLILSKNRFLLLVLFTTLIITKINATHIVGGELTYRCLNHNDLYEITLTIYRDCIHAQAEFDDPACVGVYSNSTGILYKTLNIPYIINAGNPDTIQSPPCVFTDEPVCVERYIYKDTLTLPLNVGGYLISYQRCCRNETLKNIIDPLKTGTTFYVLITTAALKDCNSSPVFKALPRNFVCINEVLEIDQSAVDVNGDSLVYKLCTPLTGGQWISLPKPCPPSFPPYNAVKWKPPYSETNMLGNSNPLKINPSTGKITGIPDSAGQYLVGVCVEEYRNGLLYSSVRRDFEYNVVQCVHIQSDWVAKTNCGSLKAEFINKSTMSDYYNWTYTDIYKSNGQTTLFKSDSDTIGFNFIFPDTGTYKVCLESSLQGTNCIHDTLCKLVKFDPILQVDNLFDDTLNICKDKLVDLNPDTIPNYRYKWINATGLIPSDNVANPKVTPSKTTTYLMMYWDPHSSCPPDTQQVSVYVKRELDSLDFKIKVKNCCDTVKVEVYDIGVNQLPGISSLNWYWTLTTPYGNQVSFDSIPIFKPIIKTTKGNDIVSIKLIAITPDSCIYLGSNLDTITPFIITNGPLIPFHKICKGEKIMLYPNANPGLIYDWEPKLGLIPNNKVPNPTVSPNTKTHYTVTYSDPDCHCIYKDSVLVDVLDTVNLDFKYRLLCDNKTVIFTNKSFLGLNGFVWMFGDQDNTSSTEINPVFTYNDFGTYTVTLFTKDTTVCADTVKMNILIKDTTAFFECEEDCSNPFKFSFKDLTSQQDTKIIHWEWKVDDILFDTIQNPMYVFPDSGIYTISMIVTYENLCMDTVIKKYTLNRLNLNIADTVFSCFGKPVQLNPGGNQSYTYIWSPCNGSIDNCGKANPIVSPVFSPAYYVTVTYILPCGNVCTYLDTVIVLDFNPILVPDTVDCSPHKIFKVLNVTSKDSIIWEDIEGNTIGIGNNFVTDIIDSTLIILGITSTHGCTLNDTFLIKKPFGIPVLDIIAKPDSFCVDANTVLLFATYNPEYIYKWSPPETLSKDDIYNPIGHPTETITYYTTVTDEHGCIALDSIIVYEKCLCNVYLPNAFSPNDDQINDVLYVRGENFRSMELIIYNRWGEMVFSTTDQNIGWDGKHGGERYDSDVFAFYLNVICLNGEKYTKKGNINLIR